MEGMVLEIKEKVEEMENFLSSLKKRFDKLFDESCCQGDLCSCITFYKGTESQMKDLFRQMKAINNRLSEKDLEDKARDRKLEQLSKEIANMRIAETATNSQTVIPKINSRKERADIEQRKNTPNVTNRSRQTNERNDGNRSGQRKGSSSERRRSDSCGNHDKSFDSDNERNDTNQRLTLRTEASGEKREQQKQNPGPRNRNSNTQSSNLQLPREEEPNHDNISKPNFKHSMDVALRQPSSLATASALEQARGGLPVVERQTEKEYYLSPNVWDVEAKAEEVASQKTALRKLEEVTTILLIDTSESMAAGDTWRQVTTFVNDYVDGLEEMSTKYKIGEHLALVTFGAQTRCHQRYTNDFSLIRSAFNKLQLGGPSPLHGGLMMADAVSLTCEKDLISLRNGLLVYTKIILITDGEPTEICLHRGPDIPDPKQMDEAKTMSVMLMESMSSKALDMFCVPVGDANKDFLNLLFSKEGGRRFLNYMDGKYFSKRYFLTAKLEPFRTLLWGIKYEIPRHDPELTARDFAHMQEIIDDATTKNVEQMKRKEENPYQEATNERLLPVGSRVRRGPDWTNGVEDDEGPGTVIGHNLYRDMLWVNWDKTEEIGQYSYGDIGLYGVLPVDEPRILLPGQPLNVGCVVTTGKDWKDDEEAPVGSRGVIIKMGATQRGIRKAVVCWENGKRTVSSYGDDKIYEIMLCLTDQSVPAPITSPPIRPALQYRPQRPALQTHRPARPAITAPRNSEPTRLNKNQTKNKNKNCN